MQRPPLEVADIFRAHGRDYLQIYGSRLAAVQLRAVRAIQACRTAALGGHLQECDRCGYQHNAYNSCLNRNCPKCQSTAARKWLQKRESELLNVPYFHVVFTIPKEIAALALGNQRAIYRILFDCVSKTLLQVGAEPRHLGGQLGFLAILHTWGQTLEYHPHIHCVVAGGALRGNGSWNPSRKKFLMPVKVLSAIFRGKLLTSLNRTFTRGQLKFSGNLAALANKTAFGMYLTVAAKKQWQVYCKPPFGGPHQVLRYLGRYTHRIAISNHRLLSMHQGQITFNWRDYRDHNTTKKMILSAHEFIRRFLLHVVPSRFVRIRHYGFLSTRNRTAAITSIRSSLFQDAPSSDPLSNRQPPILADAASPFLCPHCGIGHMKTLGILLPIPAEDSS